MLKKWSYIELNKWILSGCDQLIAIKVIELDISRINITVLPQEIGNLINLKYFDCSQNKITKLITF